MKTKLLWLGILLISSLAANLSVSRLMAQDNQLQLGSAMGRNAPVPIRAEQSASSEALGTLERGEVLTVIDVDGSWAQVEYGDLVGWVQKGQLVNADAPQPGPLGFAYMAHDSESDRLVLFGGEDFIVEPIFQDDTWTYDPDANRWTHMRPEQVPQGGGNPVAYDAQSDRLILFVGATGLPEELAAETWSTQTWAYDLNTDTWQNMEPETSPPPTLGAGMAYDAESDRTILFGGADPLRLAQGHFFSDETWAYDFETNSWTEMHPAVSPPGRSLFAVAYDTLADRVVLFGGGIAVVGNKGFSLAGDTWSYDYNTDTWREQATPEAPLPRVLTAMTYDSKRNGITLFGGANPFQGKAFGDTWTYDFETTRWTEVSPDGSPSERAWHAMAYDSLADRIILFGGGADLAHFTMETWLYDPEANTWALARPGQDESLTESAEGIPAAVQELALNGVNANADWEPYVREFDGVEMVLVPAGCFVMGSTDEQLEGVASPGAIKAISLEEQPAHEQCFDEPFWIDKNEVTNAQFEQATGVALSGSRWNEPKRPRESIDWFEARDYCELRGGYLPSEAEWEYAARGPDDLVFPWGNTFIGENVVYGENSNGQTAEVGSRAKGASWVGALDMSGNVGEWTSSIYASYPYDSADGREDNTNETEHRVLRGGSHNLGAVNLRAADRLTYSPGGKGWLHGTRCARAFEGIRAAAD